MSAAPSDTYRYHFLSNGWYEKHWITRRKRWVKSKFSTCLTCHAATADPSRHAMWHRSQGDTTGYKWCSSQVVVLTSDGLELK